MLGHMPGAWLHQRSGWSVPSIYPIRPCHQDESSRELVATPVCWVPDAHRVSSFKVIHNVYRSLTALNALKSCNAVD